jgi:nitrogen-specific signal transduction histidine kinase
MHNNVKIEILIPRKNSKKQGTGLGLSLACDIVPKGY